MSHKTQRTQHNSAETIFRLTPLVSVIRLLIAGGLLAGPVAQVHADLPVPGVQIPGLPVPMDAAAGMPWVGSGSADYSTHGNTLQINQHSDKAILNWKSFNVGTNNAVQFDQPSSSSVALNRIFDNNPSQILGHITANGQIYLVNANGFIFGKDSVVNTNTLVASALNISDEAFKNGIIREFGINAGPGQAALNGQTGNPATSVNPSAAIKVNAGANIHVNQNGNIILAAPTVSNAGSITGDQNAQIILVASQDKVYLQPASSSSPFAGLLVEVGTGGKVSNESGGQISTRLGNITLAGFAVNQSGRINATTSVDVNGSVRLLARENATDDQGSQTHILKATQTVRPTDLNDGLGTQSSVTFGTGSSVQILADANGGSNIDSVPQSKSYIEVSADNIDMKSGSSIVATSGNVNFTATDKPDQIVQSGTQGRIDLESGSVIDVSGTKNIVEPMSRNVSSISVQSYNLRNSPYQRGGVLQGQTVQVDIRNLPTIIDASSATDNIKRSIDERLIEGGTINLNSGGDVVVNSGAVTNISGGSITYRDGYINTTKLLSATGHVVDISKANPNEQYTSIFGIVTELHQKWGVTTTWDILGVLGGAGQFEKGYTQGMAAGALNIQSPLTAFDGQLIAGTDAGLYQRSQPASGGTFTINQGDNGNGSGFGTGVFFSSQNVLFQAGQQALLDIGINDKFPKKTDKQAADLVISAALVNQSGISNLNIKTGGNATIASDTALSMPALSHFNIDASNIDVKGSIHASGGSISLNSFQVNGTDGSGQLKVESSSALDVSGTWVNDFHNGLTDLYHSPVIINAGTVSLTAEKAINFDQGAVIKADGGAWLDTTGRNLTDGNAGSISLSAGTPSISGGSLAVNGTLSAYGLSSGGSLNLTTAKINIGSASNEKNALNLGVTNGSFDIAPQLGFSTINLVSNDQNITVKANTDLSLITHNRTLNKGYREQASSNSIAGFSQIVTLPENLRKPLTLGLNASTSVTMETGSTIQVDKQSTVNITSSNKSGKGIYIDGLIDAPSGSINVAFNAEQRTAYDPTQSIWLGSKANLTTHGTSRLNPPDALGRVNGAVLDGGKVSLMAQRGYVVLEQGSQIDVSGASAKLDLPAPNPSVSGLLTVSREVGSNAGSVSVTAAEGIVLDGAFHAQAGSPSNQGGSLNLTLDRNNRNEADFSVFPINALQINVQQTSQKMLPADMHFGSAIADSILGQATVASDQVAKAGFDNLQLTLPTQKISTDNPNPLPGQVLFKGDVNLNTASSIAVDAQTIGWTGSKGSSTGAVNIDTPYLQLGSTTIGDVTGASSLGGGKLATHTTWTQLNGASLYTGFNQIDLNSKHDLRVAGYLPPNNLVKTFTGNLSTSANLNLNASQIYPVTLSNFTFSSTGQVTITGSNTDTTPLSAAGTLAINAPVINQNGVLKAPMGTIELNAATSLSFGNGSFTSVSADNKTVPFGIIQNNVWEYPLKNTSNIVFNTAPDNLPIGQKRLVFKSPDIQFQKGSVVDVSGGGDLQAIQFQPGLGGQYDYLDPTSPSYQGGFAILPALGSSLAPYDPFLTTHIAYNARASVYLNGTGSLPAGEYTVLPARYALLPGAYLVTPQNNTQDQFTTSTALSGLPIVSGYNMLAGTHVHDSRTSGFLIETSAQVQKHSTYDIQSANSFFPQQAAANDKSVPLLPVDSGLISIDASSRLLLDGQFNTAAGNGGRGARMDISSQNIEVVNSLSPTATPGTLEILGQSLSQLHVDSLFLGGNRQLNNVTGQTSLNVTANNVTFDPGVKIQALDLIAAAKSKIEVMSGASINSSGTVNTGDSIFNLTSDSALLRVSADNQVTVNRASSSGLTGSLLIDQGAVLSASKSMLLDAATTILNGDIVMHGGSLNLSAAAINMGDVTGLTGNALNLSNQKLANLTVDQLVLNSRSSVNFYGNVGRFDSSGNLAPATFNNLVINAAGLSGFGSSGQTANLQANNLTLANPLNAVAAALATGQGRLNLLAVNYTQGAGDFGLNGFNTVNLNVNNGFTADGTSVLTAAGDVHLTAGYLTTTGGSNFTLDNSGHALQVNGNGSTINTAASALGGSMAFTANTIGFDTNALLASGKLSLHALTGNVSVGPAANIDLAGRAVAFADLVSYTPGGTFSAIADNGSVTMASGSALDLSTGGGSAAGGNLVLKAPAQTVTLDGQIKASAGSATIDVSSASNFDSLMAVLKNAGIDNSIYFRSRDAAGITQAASTTINANNITLAADNGNADIFGQLHANGSAQGGNLNVYAGGKVILEAGSQLTATGAIGGNVLLSSVDSLAGGIDIKAGSSIDISGSSGAGGVVTLSAMRTANGVNISPVAGAVNGYSQFYAQGVQKYSNVNTVQIDSDTANYMNAAAANVSALYSSAQGAGIRLRPGVEIDYNGNLTLSSPWDFSSQRFGPNNDITGSLIITASGAINLNPYSSITDGFNFGQLQNGDSWSFQLVAGADQSSADKFATATASDLTIGSNSSIHTGSGDIKLAAGGNIVFTDQFSTVYNAGRADSPSSLAGDYPVAGGDLVIRAGGDIKGAVSSQFIDGWFVRQGGQGRRGIIPTAWGIKANQFQQNIGSFGGGKVDIAASGNINDLSVMMPTTGKPTANGLQIQGGGTMRVNAGGDITGGAYYLGMGEGSISAGGQITGSASTNANAFTGGPQLVMSGNQFDPVNGNSTLTLNANQGIQITAVSDAMLLTKPSVIRFFSYTDKSKLTLNSLSGDVHLNADTSVASGILGISNHFDKLLTQAYPASLDATAFSGSVMLDNHIVLFPSAVSNVNILAKQDISSASSGLCNGTTNGLCSIVMSDANPVLLPNESSAPLMQGDQRITQAANLFDANLVTTNSPDVSSVIHSIVPLHGADNAPARLVTQTGDISSIIIDLPKQAIIQAGRDLINNPIQIQQINQTDASVISAGRDLIFTTILDSNGNVDTQSAINKIEIAGPGDVLLKTGRNLDLGASIGLTTIGNLSNSNLPANGASLDILVGLHGGAPNYTAVIGKYLQTNPLYANQFKQVKNLISGFMRQRTGNSVLSDSGALAAFSALTPDQTLPVQPQLNAILTQVFFNELKIAGSAAAVNKSAGYKGGFDAIDTLFPGSQWKGDLSLFFSKLQTVSGGDINLLVPGGQVNAGLSVAPTGIGAKTADQLGITAQGQGNINAFVGGRGNNFNVNTSRVFTLGGGDILIWASDGDIDAGKGAKSALSVTVVPPFYDAHNVLVVPAPKITNGSGIRTAGSGSITPGNVFLFAPQGVVDAGEAGIGGTNVTISATAVLGASNIQVSGVSTGVPVAATGSVAAGLTGASNLTANVSQVAQATAGLNDNGNTGSKNTALGIFSVDVLGFGD